jgi:hypothetical protein
MNRRLSSARPLPLAAAGEAHADRSGWAEGDEAAGARQCWVCQVQPVVAAQPGEYQHRL